MAKMLRMTAPAQILDRTVKHSRIKFALDPSEGQLLTHSRARSESVSIVIVPNKKDCPDMAPILVSAKVRRCILEVENAVIENGRIPDLEYLINDEKAIVTAEFGWVDQGELFDDGQAPVDGDDPQSPQSVEFAEDPVPRCGEAKAGTAVKSVNATETIEIKCRGMKLCQVSGKIEPDGDDLKLTWRARLGNYDSGAHTFVDPFKSRRAAIETLRYQVNQWLDAIEIIGTSDSRRATSSRRDVMRLQVNARLDKLVENETTET